MADNGAKPALLLKEKAYREIHKAILHEIFRPGEFLSERRLIEYLGMSKTPIKSALDRLEAEGFVQVWPKQGIVVKELSYDRIRDIFELRLALELFVCELVSGKLRPEQALEFERNLELQYKTAEAGDEAGFTQADSDFHILLSRCSGNAEIHSVMKMYQDHLFRSALKVLKRVPNRMQAAYRDHLAIYEALGAGETERARQLMRDHLNFGKGILVE